MQNVYDCPNLKLLLHNFTNILNIRKILDLISELPIVWRLVSLANSHKNRARISYVLLALLVFALLAFVLSLFLVCKHSGACTSSFGCAIDQVDGCAELGKSRHSRFQIPFTSIELSIASLGLFYYAFITALALSLLWQSRSSKPSSTSLLTSALAFFAVFGFVVDIFLAYRNMFVLVHPCLLCVYTYICQFCILLSALWLYLDPHYRQKQKQGTREPLALLLRLSQALGLPLGGALLLSLCIVFLMPSPAKEHTAHQGHNHNHSHSHAGSGLAFRQNFPLLEMSKVASVLRELESMKLVDLTKHAPQSPSYEGGPDAYISIHEWLDFRCPHCLHGTKLTQALKKRWPGRIKVYYRYFPLDAHCNPAIRHKQADQASCEGARAAICSAQESYFSDFFHRLFAFQSSHTAIGEASLAKLNEELGGNWPQFKECMQRRSTQEAIMSDVKAAQAFEISATPTFVVNGRLLPAGVPQSKWLVRVIDALVLKQEGKKAIEFFLAKQAE